MSLRRSLRMTLCCAVLVGCGDDSDGDAGGGGSASSMGGDTSASTTGVTTGGNGGNGGMGGMGGGGGSPAALACAAGTVVERCETPIDDDGNGAECAEWSHLYGNGEQQVATKPALSPLGDVYFGGFLSFNGVGGTVTFGGQIYAEDADNHSFVGKIGADGEEQWLKLMPAATAIAALPDGGVLVSTMMAKSQDFGGGALPYAGPGATALVAYDADGNHVWSRLVDASGNFYFERAIVGASGDIVLSGSLLGSLDGGSEQFQTDDNDDLVLMKIDGADGTTLWTKLFDNPFNLLFLGRMALDAQDNVYFAGPFNGTLNFGGADIPSLTAESSYLARLDPNGNHVWSRLFCSNCQVTELAIDDQGSAILTGLFGSNTLFDPNDDPAVTVGTVDVFLSKVSADQAYLWTKTYGSTGIENVQSVGTTCGGDILLTYTFQGGPVQIGDVQIPPGSGAIKFTSDATPLWYRAFAGAGTCDVSAGATGEVALGCTSANHVDFGAGALMGELVSSPDVAVAKIAP